METRNTIQLETVYSYVSGTKTHPTAEQVWAAVSQSVPGISLKTVYRNLYKLTGMGLIRHIPVPNEPDRFDSTMVSHQHILCECCGAFDDVFVAHDPLLADAAPRTEYEITGCDIVFHGICPSCKDKLNKI